MMTPTRLRKILSDLDGERLVEESRRILLNGGYPNPDRVACPGDKVLNAIAFREMPLRDADEYVFHLGICSPCFIEYEAFRKRARRRKTLKLVLAGALLLAVVAAAVWLWKSHRSNAVPQNARVPAVGSH